MRQGNGSDLLGLKDPRSTKIGIIYVGPNDDRKSVLAAILTQEKLGRKQIAIVLPEDQQNKAFQGSQDFDDLKTIRRKLRAELIFVTPAGPGLAEFARQRHFSVYSSLESYTDALRAEPLPADKGKKGRLFGFGKRTAPLAGAIAGGAAAAALSGEKGQSIPIASPAPTNKIVENALNHSQSPYTDLPTADLSPEALQRHRDNDASLPTSRVDQTPPIPAAGTKDTASPSTARSSAAAANGAAAGIVAADLINKSAQRPVSPDVSSASMNDDGNALPPAPSTSSPQTNAPSPSFAPDTPDSAVGAGPGIIELPSPPRAPYGQATAKQPAKGVAAGATSAMQPSAIPQPDTTSQRRNTGKMAVVTGATAAASTAHGSGASRPPIRGSRSAQTGAARRKPGSRGLIAAVLITAILLVGGCMVMSASGLPLFHSGLFAGGNISPATITITPESKIEQDSYVIQAVTSNADPTKRQVSLRQLTFSPQKQSKSVTATGTGHIAATPASGTLVFSNGSGKDYPLEAGTSIQNSNGISVTTNQFVDIPAGNPLNNFVATISIPAHAANPGTAGNIGALSIDQFCCASGNAVGVKNPNAFSGGKDQKDYTFLQQSDVDGVVNQLKPTLSQQAQNGFKGQVKSNEQLVSDPQCAAQPNVDQPVGDQGQNVTPANVTISATCTGLAYDASGAQTLAQNLLKSKAIGDLGQGYALAGTIITKQTVTDVKDSVVTLQVAATSMWYYQFDDQQKQALANQLVNKSREAAQRLLNDYRGIAKAKIDIANGGDSLPSDPKQISIMVLAVSGASSADLPALPAPPAMEPTSPLAVNKERG